jgi:signal transduction histidine kinase
MVAMSLLKQKKVTLEQDKINIIDFVKELDKTMSKKAEEKNISLKVEMKELLNKDLIVDEARLQQALVNILNNAIEYTAEGGHVNLTVEQKPSKIFNIAKYEFTIKDDGIGMSDGFQAIALEPFTKEDVSPEGLLKGSGLGLAISRNIIELMDGKISLSSKKNHGTTVLVKVNFNINYNSTK